MTTHDAAARLGLSLSYVYQLIRAGKLRATRVGRDWVIEMGEVEAFEATPRRGVGRPRKVRG